MSSDDIVSNQFACPHCHGTLQWVDAGDDGLGCMDCGARFPVVAGIPRFVSSDNYAASFGEQWNRYRCTQLDSHTGLPISRERLFSTTRWPERLEGQHVLEAGSGSGRFTEVLLTTGAWVYSFDYSTAVDANASNHGGAPKLRLFQGDILRPPFAPARFDKVLCLGVLQHTPDPARAFASLAAQVKPGGQLAVDIYAKRLTALLSWRYVLRPLTTRMSRARLQAVVERSVDAMLPAAAWLRKRAGRAGARLLPIVEHSTLGLSPVLEREWAVLDTFDQYSPAHDHPQTLATLKGWFETAGFTDVVVVPGPNGIIGRGRRP